MEKEKEKETKNHAVVAAAKAEEDERLKWEEQQKQRIEKLKRMAEGGASATIGDGGDDDNGDDNENSRVRAVSEASEELMYLTRAKSSDSGTSKRSTNTNRRGSFEDAAKRGSLETETETKILHKFDRMPGFSFVKEGELSPQNVEYILEFVDVGDCDFFAGVGNSENFYSHPINSSMAKDV